MLSKNEETWCKVLGDFLSQKLFNPESIRRVVSRTTPCTLLRNPNGNRNVLYLYRHDDGSWNWNYNWVDNDNWNASNPSAVLATLSISPLEVILMGFFYVYCNHVVCLSFTK